MEHERIDRMKNVIHALLAKTVANGCTEAEAASAMAKAQELLLRYNLQEQEVHAHSDGTEELRQKVGMQDIEVAGGFKWRTSLLSAVAHANLCRIVISDRGDRGTLHVFGTGANVAVVVDMWHWMEDQLERLGFASLRNYMQPTQQASWIFEPDGTARPRPWTPKGTEDEATYLAGFYRAAVSRVDSRLQAALYQFTRESDQTRALVTVSGQSLSTAVRTQFPRLGTWSGMGNAGRDGLADGRKAGDRVKLTRDPALSGAGGVSLRLGAGR